MMRISLPVRQEEIRPITKHCELEDSICDEDKMLKSDDVGVLYDESGGWSVRLADSEMSDLPEVIIRAKRGCSES